MAAGKRRRTARSAEDEGFEAAARGPGVDVDMLEDIVGYPLRRAQTAIYQDYQRAMAEHGIRPAQFAVLVIAGKSPGLTQSALAEAMGIDRSGSALLIDALEKKGLVARIPSATDRRSYAIMLTVRGQGVLDRMKELVHEHDRRVCARLTPEERTTLIALLKRLY
ncbi:MarR family winged helix-turn-helix transcriptional regulator [Azospirillum sp. sgz301742]